jgi:hypothetical protein
MLHTAPPAETHCFEARVCTACRDVGALGRVEGAGAARPATTLQGQERCQRPQAPRARDTRGGNAHGCQARVARGSGGQGGGRRAAGEGGGMARWANAALRPRCLPPGHSPPLSLTSLTFWTSPYGAKASSSASPCVRASWQGRMSNTAIAAGQGAAKGGAYLNRASADDEEARVRGIHVHDDTESTKAGSSSTRSVCTSSWAVSSWEGAADLYPGADLS